MANQMSWREACGAAWGRLTGVDNEGSAAGVRLLFFLLFLLGTLGNVFKGAFLIRLAKFFVVKF